MNLLKTHFSSASRTILAKELFKTKDEKQNNDLVKLIMDKWSILKDEVKKISEDEKEIKEPNKLLDMNKKILDFNREQQGLGLKILTPDQMLSRLPITLAQLKAGNNSEKLKNKIRQLLYSLDRSKKLTKQLYKSLTRFKNGNNLYEH